jgi:large subunit ribosomal protein L9
VKHAETWRNSRATRETRERTHAEDLKAKLEAQSLVVPAQAGPDGRLFGSVTAAQIADTIAATAGVEIDRHRIELAEPIRHLGIHEVTVVIHGEVSAQVAVEVVEAPTV